MIKIRMSLKTTNIETAQAAMAMKKSIHSLVLGETVFIFCHLCWIISQTFPRVLSNAIGLLFSIYDKADQVCFLDLFRQNGDRMRKNAIRKNRVVLIGNCYGVDELKDALRAR